MRKALPVILVAGCASEPQPGWHDLYRLTGEHLPTSGAAVAGYSVDLDGTGASNQLGGAFELMATFQVGDPQAGTDQAFAMQPPELVIDVQRGEHGDLARVNAFAGDADTYDPTMPTQPPLEGSSQSPFVTATGGDLPAVIAPFGVAIPIVLHDAHVKLYAGPDSLDGYIAGGVDPTLVTDQLIPQWQPVLQALEARDCTRPGCGCVPGTPGANAQDYFDTNRDCTITLDEIGNTTLVTQILSTYPAPDGRPVITLGFGIEGAFVRTVE